IDAPIGLIPSDSLYSPIRQVSYKVDNARVGQELDYDKLSITVETDGTVTPEDAVAYAARILQDQLTLFVHFEDGIPQAVPTMIGMAAPAEESDANQLNRYPKGVGNDPGRVLGYIQIVSVFNGVNADGDFNR